MAALITSDELQGVLPSVDPTKDLTVFIDMADLIVTENLTGKGLSDTRLKMIELNLAAHFYTASAERGGMTYQKAGQAEEGYSAGTVNQAVSGKSAFSTTSFGQTAMMLDTSGTLFGLGLVNKAQFRVVSACE